MIDFYIDLLIMNHYLDLLMIDFYLGLIIVNLFQVSLFFAILISISEAANLDHGEQNKLLILVSARKCWFLMLDKIERNKGHANVLYQFIVAIPDFIFIEIILFPFKSFISLNNTSFNKITVFVTLLSIGSITHKAPVNVTCLGQR